MLRENGSTTFEEGTQQQWQDMHKEARVREDGEMSNTAAIWRNPDIAKSDSEFKILKELLDNLTIAKFIHMIPMGPTSGGGERYCLRFQSGRCNLQGEEGRVKTDKDGMATVCQLGLHRCAALFKGGRSCHMVHPGIKCKRTKRGSKLPADAAQLSLKKMKVEEGDRYTALKKATTLALQAPPKPSAVPSQA